MISRLQCLALEASVAVIWRHMKKRATFCLNLTSDSYKCNKTYCFYLQSPFADLPIVAKMLAKLLRRSSSTTSDGINTWELPRLHRNAYCNNKEKIAHILNKKKVDVNKIDSRGRYVCFRYSTANLMP